jgi:hypothetical protein
MSSIYHPCQMIFKNLDIILTSVTNINRDMLEREWSEMDSQADMCHVTQGSHVECFYDTISKLNK